MLIQPKETRQSGSVLLASICILVALGALGAAHFAVVQNNFKQSKFFAIQSYLHQYAESGVALAIHDFDNYLTDYAGNIGTTNWSETDDVGADGVANTLDEGESDGIPTPGEPNLEPADIGPSALGIKLLVSVYPTPYVGVFRIVSTCFNKDGLFTTQRVYRNTLAKFTLPSAIYVNPEIQVTYGEGFESDIEIIGIDESDTIPDSDDNFLAMSTSEGETEGDNLSSLVAQVSDTDAVLDDGSGTPSIGEVEGVNFTEIFDSLRGKASIHLQTGDYSDILLGALANFENLDIQDATLMGEDVNAKRLNKESKKTSRKVDRGKISEEEAISGCKLRVVYVDGDLVLRGQAGKAVLVINGDLEIVGPCQFEGVLIVRGDVSLQGGGEAEEITIQGGLMIDGAALNMSGDVTIVYFPEILDGFKEEIRSYFPLFYKET